MYPEDIEALHNSVPVGTSVYIVKQPVKVGWLNNVLYIEAHPDLEGEEKTQDQRYAAALALIQKANNGELPEFDQVALNKALKDLDGTPVPLYERLPPLEEEMPATEPELIPEISPEPVAKSPKPIPVALVKTEKTAVAKSSKAATVMKTANKSTKQVPITASKSNKQAPVTASKSKKPETVTASKSKKQEPVTASKSTKQVQATASKSKKPEPVTASKTNKQASTTASKSKKKEPATTSKSKKQGTATVSKSPNEGSPGGYYRGA
jgi:L,D-transpeptidase ErfK/SrfK